MDELIENPVKTIEKPPDLPKIKPKQLNFVRLYHKSGNATKSYEDAGYSSKGAQQSSSTLLLKPVVQAHLQHLRDKSSETHEVIFGSLIERTNDITMKAERGKLRTTPRGYPIKIKGELQYEDDLDTALKGLKQLGEWGGLADKDKRKADEPQVWTGMVFDFTLGTLKFATGPVVPAVTPSNNPKDDS